MELNPSPTNQPDHDANRLSKNYATHNVKINAMSPSVCIACNRSGFELKDYDCTGNRNESDDALDDSDANQPADSRLREQLKNRLAQFMTDYYAASANDSLSQLKANDEHFINDLEALCQEIAREAVSNAFDELRATPKDSWYGTMPEILARLTQQPAERER